MANEISYNTIYCYIVLTNIALDGLSVILSVYGSGPSGNTGNGCLCQEKLLMYHPPLSSE